MKEINCPLCGGNTYDVLYSKEQYSSEETISQQFKCTNVNMADFYRVVKCRVCGLIYNNPCDSPEKLNEIYGKVVDEDYLNEISGRLKTYEVILNELDEFKKEGKLLDIGCYAGIFLQAALKRGFDAEGLEPSRWAADIARNDFGLKVHNGTLLEFHSEKKYDIITMWDVVEHLYNIKEVFLKMNKMLAPGGAAAFSTHNIESFPAKILRSKYPFIMRMHICHFSLPTLKKLCGETGFKILKITPHIRYLRAGYFLKKLKNYNKLIYAAVYPLAKLISKEKLIKINFSGLINVYAKKEKEI